MQENFEEMDKGVYNIKSSIKGYDDYYSWFLFKWHFVRSLPMLYINVFQNLQLINNVVKHATSRVGRFIPLSTKIYL